MDRESIMKMEPGREMDEEIFTKVMGERLANSPYRTNVPSYSISMADAWSIIDELSKYGFQIQRLGDYFDEGPEWEGWECGFSGFSDRMVKAKTAPLAICRAALLTVLEDKDHV